MRKLILLSITLLVMQDGFSCDQCSVQVGSGVLLEGHYIGHAFRFRKQFGNFELGKSLGGPKHLDHFAARGEVKELFTVHELTGNYHMAGNWHLTAAIPLVNNYRSVNGVSTFDVFGLGDPWALIRNQRSWDKDSGKLWLAVGVGAKLPIGKTDILEEGTKVDLDMQPGSGSLDLLSSVSVVREYARIFLIGQAAFSYMGESPGDYRYGNSMSGAGSIGYRLTRERILETSLMLGASAEILGRDKTYDERTGDRSSTVYADAGLQMQLNQRLIGSISAQRAVVTTIDDRQLPTIYRVKTSLRYTF